MAKDHIYLKTDYFEGTYCGIEAKGKPWLRAFDEEDFKRADCLRCQRAFKSEIGMTGRELRRLRKRVEEIEQAIRDGYPRIADALRTALKDGEER